MPKSAVGLAALVSLGLGLVVMACISIWSPYGGHSVAGWALLSFFLVALGLVLGLVSFVRGVILRARSGRGR